MSVNLAEQFVEEIYSLRSVEIPKNTVWQAKRCLLDYLSATFAGAQMLAEKGNKLLDNLEQTDGDAAVIGFNKRASAENAAFVNGLSAHVAELDDGVISGIVHPGSPLCSALLPVAEKERVSGSDLLLGIIAGYEAAVRISEAIQPSHKKRGYHATGTCGAIGVAMGTAAMLGLSKTQMKNTLSSAAVSASGSLKVLEDDSELKPYNVAQAAHGGLMAVLMARAGFMGPEDVLSGNTGFFAMMADELDVSSLKIKEGEPFAVERVYVKPYAACRYCHPAIEAAMNVKSDHLIPSGDIESVDVHTYQLAVTKHDHTQINGVSSAKMSIPYSVAVALFSGKADIMEFSTERIADPDVRTLTQKISVHADPQLTDLFPAKSAATIEIATKNGKRFTKTVDMPKGEPENQLSDTELEAKFTSLATYGSKTDNESREIIDIVWNLEERSSSLFQLL